MLRATRHRRIIDIIQRARVPVTAQTIAEKLEVTVRTIYRDVSALIDDGVPIRGEAGVGYVMRAGYELPPLMFSVGELEALMLGARMVVARADEATARAAADVIAKISAAIPVALQPVLVDAPLYAAPSWLKRRDQIDLTDLREALRSERRVRISYADGNDEATERTIWPLSIGYFENRRIVVAWCELRNAFRHFRTDRIRALTALDERLPKRRALLLATWREERQERSYARGLPKLLE